MTEYFVDTSALGKRYVPEIGSNWVTSWIEPKAGNITIICAVTTVEMVSIFARREREGHLQAADRIRLQNDFLIHVQNEYLTVEMDNDVLAEARNLLVKYPLRALDALQLASVRQSTRFLGVTPTFISADQRLLSAATAEGFAVDDPNAHP